MSKYALLVEHDLTEEERITRVVPRRFLIGETFDGLIRAISESDDPLIIKLNEHFHFNYLTESALQYADSYDEYGRYLLGVLWDYTVYIVRPLTYAEYLDSETDYSWFGRRVDIDHFFFYALETPHSLPYLLGLEDVVQVFRGIYSFPTVNYDDENRVYWYHDVMQSLSDNVRYYFWCENMLDYDAMLLAIMKVAKSVVGTNSRYVGEVHDSKGDILITLYKDDNGDVESSAYYRLWVTAGVVHRNELLKAVTRMSNDELVTLEDVYFEWWVTDHEHNDSRGVNEHYPYPKSIENVWAYARPFVSEPNIPFGKANIKTWKGA